MLTYSILRPTHSYDLLGTALRKSDFVCQPDESAIRVDFRLFGYRWIISGTRGLKTRTGEWVRYDITYPINGRPTIEIREAGAN